MSKASEQINAVVRSSETPIITRWETGYKNFYAFVSHTREGKPNISYGLVNDHRNMMVEVIPVYGPVTTLQCDRGKEITEEYVQKRLDRGNWTQDYFDKNGLNEMIAYGEFEKLIRYLESFLN